MLTFDLHRDKRPNENFRIHGRLAIPHGVDGEWSSQMPYPVSHLCFSIDSVPDERVGEVTTCLVRWCSMALALTESNESSCRGFLRLPVNSP